MCIHAGDCPSGAGPWEVPGTVVKAPSAGDGEKGIRGTPEQRETESQGKVEEAARDREEVGDIAKKR